MAYSSMSAPGTCSMGRRWNIAGVPQGGLGRPDGGVLRGLVIAISGTRVALADGQSVWPRA